MSRKELVLLVSRAFALLLITWAFVELTYLPDRVLGLIHHVNERSVLAAHDYWSSCTERNDSLLESADGSMATAAARREGMRVEQHETRIPLTPTGLLMEGRFTQNAGSGYIVVEKTTNPCG